MIEKGLQKSKTHQIVDLGSGGGGGLIWLNSWLKKNYPNLRIILSNYYPNIPAFIYTEKQADNFEYIEKPIDARDVPPDLKGLKTLFLTLHHFKPEDAKNILQNAIRSNSSIAVFEAQESSFKSIIAMLLSPLSVIFTIPFIRPFKIGRIIFTYLIPIVPLFVLWDGVVSCLRTYSVKEMNDLITNVTGKEDYDWEIDKIKSGPGSILYLLGTRKN